MPQTESPDASGSGEVSVMPIAPPKVRSKNEMALAPIAPANTALHSMYEPPGRAGATMRAARAMAISSMQAEQREDRHDHHDQADQINDSVHRNLPRYFALVRIRQFDRERCGIRGLSACAVQNR